MMRYSRCLFFGLLSLLMLSCESMEGLGQMLEGTRKPGVRVVGARLGDLTMESTTMVFDVELSNPYEVALPLLGLDYEIASSGTSFLSGQAEASGSIPAGGKKVIPVSAALPFERLLNLVKGVRPGEVVPYEATMNLAVDAPAVGRLDLPVSRKGELPIPAAPRARVKRFAVDQLSLQAVSMVLDLEIENTNAFEVGLEELDYGLTLAGSEVAKAQVTSGTTFKAGAKQSLSLPVRFSPMSAGTAVLNVLRGEAADYTLGGTMQLQTPFGPLAAPFERSGRAPIGR